MASRWMRDVKNGTWVYFGDEYIFKFAIGVIDCPYLCRLGQLMHTATDPSFLGWCLLLGSIVPCARS